MKKSLLLTSIFLSGLSFADVDYTRCMMGVGGFGGPYIDNDGVVHAPIGSTLKNKKTNGKVETYTFTGKNNFDPQGKDFEIQYKFERDDQGRIIKLENGAAPDSSSIKAFKERMILGAVTFTQLPSQSHGGIKINETQEPHFQIFDKSHIYPWPKMIPLSRLSEAEAKQIGIEDLSELKKLQKQWRKDKAIVSKLKKGYAKMMDTTPVQMPLGPTGEFEIKDGVCEIKKVSHRSYNVKSKEVITTGEVSRELCENTLAVQKKYQAEQNKCHELQQKIFEETYPGGVNGGAIGGNGGGYAGGVGGGYVSGMPGGLGMLGNGMNYGMGMCQMYFGEPDSSWGSGNGMGGDKKGRIKIPTTKQ